MAHGTMALKEIIITETLSYFRFLASFPLISRSWSISAGSFLEQRLVMKPILF